MKSINQYDSFLRHGIAPKGWSVMDAEQRRMLVETFDCDEAWIARTAEGLPHESLDEVIRKRTAFMDEFEVSHHPIMEAYGKIWLRINDLDIDEKPYIEIEARIFEAVGISGGYPSGVSMLEAVIRRFKREAEESMTIRQFEHVFDEHLFRG